jgi:hypothetical protein
MFVKHRRSFDEVLLTSMVKFDVGFDVNIDVQSSMSTASVSPSRERQETWHLPPVPTVVLARPPEVLVVTLGYFILPLLLLNLKWIR